MDCAPLSRIDLIEVNETEFQNQMVCYYFACLALVNKVKFLSPSLQEISVFVLMEATGNTIKNSQNSNSDVQYSTSLVSY